MLCQLLDPTLDMQSHNELISAVRLLVSGDQCEGRFVFGRQIQPPPKKEIESKSETESKSDAGVGGDNSKNQLQTLLARAGHELPSYKTKQLKNNQFCSTVIFNGLNFVGQPCNKKKQAEKEAAGQALLWLKGDSSHDDIEHVSILLKSKKKNRKTSDSVKTADRAKSKLRKKKKSKMRKKFSYVGNE